MQESIDNIFECLSCSNSQEKQQYGIEMASQIKNLSVLIMPIESKSVWENCAKVIVSKTDEELQLYYIKLFEWLQDMNWPGAELIYDRLSGVSNEYFLHAFQYSISQARKMEEYAWERSLEEFYSEWKLKHE